MLIFRRLWEEPGLKTSFARLLDGTTVQTDFEEAAFAFALNRLLDRMSKLRVGEWVKTIYRPEWKGLEPNHFYRALDFLAEHKGRLEEALYARVWDLFNLNWIWYCGTPPHTLKAGRRGDSRSMAFSKKRPGRVQIMIGVLASRDGFPIAHEVFPGNMAELDTFRHVVEKGKHQFHLGWVILVADRGMVSEKLPGEIEGAQLEYIVGVRVRKLKATREALSRSGRYRKVASNLWVKEVIYGGVRYMVCFNPEEKERDRRTRKQAVARLKEKLEAGEVKQLIGNSAYRRYLKINGSQVAIDEHVLQEEARYDGKYVLRTNSSPRPEEVAEAYKSLWQVERAFQELKSGLDLRPIYHWTEKRIRGHVMVCFLALVLEMALRRKIKDLGGEVRYGDLLLDFCQRKAVDLHVDGMHYLARTELTGRAEVAFRAVGVRPPLHVTEMPRA